MPRGNGDDWWRTSPAAKPIPVEGGIATSKQRGAMAETWWSNRFVTVLESYGLGGRMQRGRRYARTGQVLSLAVEPGVLAADVQGSRQPPYAVTISVAVPTPAQWAAVEAAMQAKVGFVARLLAGEMPPDLEDVFQAAGVPLFPNSYRDLRADCSCPDWQNPCKHIAAVLYVLADRLDGDPWLLLAWRGRTRDDLIGHLRAGGGASGETEHEPVAPWWPFGDGPMPELSAGPDRGQEVVTPDEPAVVLEALAPSAITVRGELSSLRNV